MTLANTIDQLLHPLVIQSVRLLYGRHREPAPFATRLERAKGLDRERERIERSSCSGGGTPSTPTRRSVHAQRAQRRDDSTRSCSLATSAPLGARQHLARLRQPTPGRWEISLASSRHQPNAGRTLALASAILRRRTARTRQSHVAKRVRHMPENDPNRRLDSRQPPFDLEACSAEAVGLVPGSRRELACQVAAERQVPVQLPVDRVPLAVYARSCATARLASRRLMASSAAPAEAMIAIRISPALTIDAGE